MTNNELNELLSSIKCKFDNEYYFSCIELLRKYFIHNNEKSIAWFMYATSLQECGFGEEAIEAFSKTLNLAPISKHNLIYGKLGELCQEFRSLVEAEYWYARATLDETLSVNEAWILILRGVNLCKLRRYKESQKCYENAIKLDEELREEAYANLAIVYSIQGNYTASANAIVEALKFHPNNKKYSQFLKKITDVM